MCSKTCFSSVDEQRKKGLRSSIEEAIVIQTMSYVNYEIYDWRECVDIATRILSGPGLWGIVTWAE